MGGQAVTGPASKSAREPKEAWPVGVINFAMSNMDRQWPKAVTLPLH